MRIPLDTLDDPRLAPYRNVKDRQLLSENRFVTEGEYIVRRLLDSTLRTESLLLAARRADEIAPLAPPDVPVYIVPDHAIHAILGFQFHSGILAVAHRPPPATLEQILPPSPAPAMIVVCPDLISAENLGAILRLSAGFGASGLLLGRLCVDPFYRHSVRVSMGTVFRLPIARSDDIPADLARLRDADVTSVATVLDRAATPLHRIDAPRRVALLLGNEAQGLASADIAAADLRATIDMKLGTDSLNVATAAAIFLHHFAGK